MVSHSRLVPSGFDRGAAAALGVLSAAAAALGAIPVQSAAAAPHDNTRAEVDRLYEEAERATEAYNKADERADELREQVGTAQDSIARQQDRINVMRESLGSLAGAQYRSGALDPSIALLFSDDPDDYLDTAAALDRINAHQAGELHDLRHAMRDLSQNRAEASAKLAELEKNRKAVAQHKRAVEGKLAAARRLLDSLPDEERAAYDRASRSGRTDMPDLAGAVAPSGRAAAAVAAARSALGKPYVWGSTGPDGFDCSGLMVWSYGQAGVGLPRTSQAQRYAGTRVPLSQARPGDLVTYRADASHVGMYAGNGQVIHAPYPGAPVRYDPVGMMPIASVTRP
ncbi:C40 family peptidase [Streptomyces europaeiscabiei]|uniref:NlpC/P60 family protein n=1 Tax=Streptomyces europaeiscabiei TaxID=146819 RepID=A0ABU4NE95_9ACTN|nr:NlpC/P60 family protein [Streptomyces europaeiscabiei]MDX2762108.1 NlpC/P60 family protein [Streptomyces europaeiscabiei]MDX2768835.1 NlpC/P60 family protein [Streptomyces europaeiscabiei]MDX3543477.1 NlpC/P60 family protein [Streptomyces europaeiscabiei]MDX3553686.1 NlpC/P60 family protein [Streptomyces europaeiscabiei]MDX3669585.1 NlpC/P60 family protein [Streptomyces europaeiscabiei]